MTKLYVQVNAVNPNDDDDANVSSVEYSVWDSEDTATISFYAEINVATACFLHSRLPLSSEKDAFDQMICVIAEQGLSAISVNQMFESE